MITPVMFACGSGSMGKSLQTLVLFLILLWIAAGILALANLIFIVKLKPNSRDRAVNGIVFLSYVVLGITLFAGGFNQNFWTIALAVFGIPILVACHFGYLYDLRRRTPPT